MKITLVLASFIAISTAAPAALSWTPELGLWYRTIANHVREAKNKGNTYVIPTCTLKDVTMDPAPTPLPAPTGTIQNLVLGRGVQNYTCDLSNSTAVPKAIGAIANLYDVSCFASNAQTKDLLDQITNLALQYPLPTNAKDRLVPGNIVRMGHHYFDAAGVPTFDLNDGNQQLGVVKAKLAAKSPAPADSVKGQNGQGFGSVPWLLLNQANGTTAKVGQVYRIHTAGGQPPAACAGAQQAFSVEYATLYYMYS